MMNEHQERRIHADGEKKRVALTSVAAAVVLTGAKLIVGLMTGSLGILSEAAHSALDLVAAVVTYFAVRVSGLPPDKEHTYGHGKVENISALFETLLLLVTCVWIIYEAVERLFWQPKEVEATFWSFAVIAGSVAIDYSRSRALMRVAKKHDSQALEADALHFSTDIWSSSVVLVGLACVGLAGRLGTPWLKQADALAALGVAGIVIWVSLRLGKRTVDDLVDAVPPELREDVARAAKVPGVLAVPLVRVRRSGADAFVELTLEVSREAGFERAHAIATEVEDSIKRVLRGAHVVVHAEPVPCANEDLETQVRVLANRRGLGVHNIRVWEQDGKPVVDLHLEVSAELTVAEAHTQAEEFEAELRRALVEVGPITTHLEPSRQATAERLAAPALARQVSAALEEVTRSLEMRCTPHDVEVGRANGEPIVSFHCTIDAGAPITAAHELTERIERDLRAKLPDLGRVVIHVEPDEDR
ncbi:MAG: cation diffusion facilitator family transporter [Pirellulales bacterium]